MSTPILMIVILILILMHISLIEIGTEYYLKRVNAPPMPGIKEFPEIDRSDLDKFTTFDSELGWERQPNENKMVGVGRGTPDSDKVVLSSDEYGSRTCSIDRSQGDFSISTYGDSYCACRGVGDKETFQHYLSQELNLHVSNYGVGNYGLDQALLRLKRRFDQDQSEFVIFAASDAQIVERLLSMWKHYLEFGNTFNVKPRYQLRNRQLQLSPMPISNKSDILDLEDHKQYIRKNDNHYQDWFIPTIKDRPYSKYWLHDQRNIPYGVLSVLEYITREKTGLKQIHSQTLKLKYKLYPIRGHVPSEPYRYQLENEYTDLLCAVLAEFSEYVQSRGSTPIFMPISYKSPEFYHIKPIRSSTKEKIKEECPSLRIVDPRDKIASQVDNHEEFFVGHPSSTHNQLIAEYLSEFIREEIRRI